MILSKTPYRISFFGGGSDYPNWYKKFGGTVISTTIDKYIYISFRNLGTLFGHKYKVVWSKIETENDLKLIKHDVVRVMLPHMGIDDPIEIHYQADLPARSGMGSSSSFVVGLMNSINTYKNHKISRINLAKNGIHFEQKILKECVGVQDLISTAIGGFNKISIQKNGKFNVNKIKFKKNKNDLNKNLFLTFTNIQRTANDIAMKYATTLTKKKEKEMLEIVSQAHTGEKLLNLGNHDDFGKLLNEAWQKKRELNKAISNKKIDLLYSYAIENGALGGKLLGAGGGGFMVLYVPLDKQKNFLKKFKNIQTVPFRFTDQGSEIILKN
tara:strand:- start:481 stop:1458 length:978 start_codon:yes stop_codon:yes gene_type:complete